jgi:hypothetical protein
MNIQERPPLFSTKLVFGLIVIAFGLILMADRLRWYDAWHLLNWWPLALAAIAIAHFVRDGFLRSGGHIWLGFAVAGFIQQFGPYGMLNRWWPAFLVWGGVIVTLRALFPPPKRSRKSQTYPPSPSANDSCDPEVDPTQVKP